MDSLAERIVAFEIAREAARQGMDRGDLGAEANVPICGMSGAPRATSSLVRRASSASAPRKAGGAFGASSISTEAPCAASVSSGR